MSDGSLVHELDRIAERVSELARLVQSLREENRTLRVAVDRRDGDNHMLRDRLDAARDRVESLIARMPGDS